MSDPMAEIRASFFIECEELIEIAERKGLVLMVGHTFLYSAAVRKIKEIVDNRDIGDLRYISARRLNLGLFQKDINVAWDLAPHDLSIIDFVLPGGLAPVSVSASSDRTAPASRRSSASSAACCSRPPATPPSTTPTCARPGRSGR